MNRNLCDVEKIKNLIHLNFQNLYSNRYLSTGFSIPWMVLDLNPSAAARDSSNEPPLSATVYSWHLQPGKCLPVPDWTPSRVPSIFSWGKNTFSPPNPVQSRHWYRQLIDFLYYRNLFNLQVHWCIIAFLCVLYKCRPLCISYFLKSSGYVFLTHQAGGMDKKNFTLFAFSCNSLLWPPFFLAWMVDPVFSQGGNSLIFLRIAWRILCLRYLSHFPRVGHPFF